MIKKFRCSKIALSVAEGKLYDETTTFNEQNIKEYLAEVEEYIKCLLTIMANQFGVKYPILMPLGLEELPKKIEPPILPREQLNEDEDLPDEETLNDMLDKTKFDSMMMEIHDRQRGKLPEEEEHKAMEDDKVRMSEERKSAEDKKNEEHEDLVKGLAGEHMADDIIAMNSGDEREEGEAKEENNEGEPKEEVNKEG